MTTFNMIYRFSNLTNVDDSLRGRSDKRTSFLFKNKVGEYLGTITLLTSEQRKKIGKKYNLTIISPKDGTTDERRETLTMYLKTYQEVIDSIKQIMTTVKFTSFESQQKSFIG